jgi:hypothetical protein
MSCVSETRSLLTLGEKKFEKPHGQSISPQSVHKRRERIATKDQTAPSLLLPINKTKNKKRKSKKKRKERQGPLLG